MRDARRGGAGWPLAGWLAALALLAGCEAAFDPIDDAGRYFSMSGYLDTEADTNWVRVELVAETFEPSPDPIDADVWLDGPGGRSALTQETVAFRTGTAHLFWTTADVEPGTTYALVAERPDGARTRATVRTPDPFETTLVDGETACPVAVAVRGAERVVDARAVYHLGPPPATRFEFSKRASLATSGGVTRAFVYWGSDAVLMGLNPLDVSNPDLTSEVVVAVATSEWPDETDLETALIPGVNAAIESGVGFVGGVTLWRSEFQPGTASAPFSPPRACFGP